MSEHTISSVVKTVLAHAFTVLLTLVLVAIIFSSRMTPGRLLPAQISGPKPESSLPSATRFHHADNSFHGPARP